MNVRSFAFLFAIISVAVVSADAELERSVSTSRQFLVFGTDLRLRGAICDLAERTKTKLLRLIDQPDDWKTPILINGQLAQANLPDAPAAALFFSQTGSGLKLQLDLAIGPDVNALAVQRELLRALILEMAYRDRPDLAAGSAFAEPPDWLLDGVVAFSADDQATLTQETLAAVAAAKRVAPLAEFLKQRRSPSDPTAQSLYRAQSHALLQLLLDMPEGRKRLAAFIANLPSASNDDFAALTQYYPELNRSADELQKLWASAVARLAASHQNLVPGIAETERALNDILQVDVASGGHRSQRRRLEEFAAFVALPESARALRAVQQKLMVLAARANPIYAPLISAYERVVAELIRHKTRNVASRLAALKTLRQRVSGRMNEIADYMNWFEATQSHRQSGMFDDYMRAAERAALPETRRRDAMSVYLDALESQFGN